MYNDVALLYAKPMKMKIIGRNLFVRDNKKKSWKIILKFNFNKLNINPFVADFFSIPKFPREISRVWVKYIRTPGFLGFFSILFPSTYSLSSKKWAYFHG
jgi:hypothetical protein